MKVSIITVCFNSAAVVATAMESVLRQTWAELEYIVVDGGSTDGTLEIVREYEERFEGRMRWLSEPDRGMYDALNKGIALATGDVVGMVHADDALADDGVVARVVEAAAEQQRYYSQVTGHNRSVKGGGSGGGGGALPGDAARQDRVDVVYGDVRFVAREGEAAVVQQRYYSHGTGHNGSVKGGDGGGAVPSGPCQGQCRAEGELRLEQLRQARTLRYYSARRWRPWMLQWGYMPPHPSVYIRRECFAELGGYALDYRIAADYALLVRYMRRAGLRSRYLPLCMVDMRTGGVSTSGWRSNLLLNKEIVRANREAGYFCCLAMMLPKYFFKVWEL